MFPSVLRRLWTIGLVSSFVFVGTARVETLDAIHGENPEGDRVAQLTLIINGVSAVGSLVGATATLVDIFGGYNDDNPLYSDGAVSPTLAISATETGFDLFLDQPLDVTEFEDDYSANLKGVMQRI